MNLFLIYSNCHFIIKGLFALSPDSVVLLSDRRLQFASNLPLHTQQARRLKGQATWAQHGGWRGGVGVFRGARRAQVPSPSLTDQAGLQESSLPWHGLQGPPQDSLLLAFAFDCTLVLDLHPRTGCFHWALVSRISSQPLPQVPFAATLPSHLPIWGQRPRVPPSSPTEVRAPFLLISLSEGLWL